MDTEEALKIAGALRRQGRFGEAEVVYRDVLRDRPESLAALEGLGVILLQQGKVDEARKTLQALSIDISAPAGLRQRAAALLTGLGPQDK